MRNSKQAEESTPKTDAEKGRGRIIGEGEKKKRTAGTVLMAAAGDNRGHAIGQGKKKRIAPLMV